MATSTNRLRMLMPVLVSPEERRQIEEYAEEMITECEERDQRIAELNAKVEAAVKEARRIEREAYRAISDLGRWAQGRKRFDDDR